MTFSSLAPPAVSEGLWQVAMGTTGSSVRMWPQPGPLLDPSPDLHLLLTTSPVSKGLQDMLNNKVSEDGNNETMVVTILSQPAIVIKF